MDAGAYRKKVKIQKYVNGFDAIGNPVNEWQDYKSAYAYVNGLSGREYWQAAAVHGENTVEFVFRWKPFFDDMNTKEYRIILNKSIYDINLIDNLAFRNKTVKIKAVAKDGKEE